MRQFLAAPIVSLQAYSPADAAHLLELKRVETWVERVGVFLFGFVLHRIETAIAENPALRQNEIWVTSFGDAVINKFVPEPLRHSRAIWRSR